MPTLPLDPAARRRPPGRYDPPPRALPRAVAVLLVLLLGGFLLAVSWSLYQRYGADDVPFSVRGFDLRERSVVVDFEASPPAGTTAWCLVRARDAEGAETGSVFVRVDAAEGGGPVPVRHELPTRARPVTGEVMRCLPQDPPVGEPTAVPGSSPSAP